MEEKQLMIPPQMAGKRIDRALSEMLAMPRSAIQRWMEQGRVLRFGDGAPFAKNACLKGGETVLVRIPDPVPCEVRAQSIPLSIVYEDGDLLVVDKPKGMVVHPAPGNPDGTLVNALLAHCGKDLSGINGVLRPGIVHRIDKNTSGLLIVAKSDRAHQGLAEQIQAHSFKRLYEAVVQGHMRQEAGTVDAPIGRHPSDRKKMAVVERHSRPAVTHYRVLASYPGYDYVELRLETGRTHQIRVHMAYLGHPVAGDTVYGPARQPSGLDGQCLHAKTIGFRHPITGQYLEFTSPLPPYFLRFLKELQSHE